MLRHILPNATMIFVPWLPPEAGHNCVGILPCFLVRLQDVLDLPKAGGGKIEETGMLEDWACDTVAMNLIGAEIES